MANLRNLPKPQKNKKKSKTLLTKYQKYGIMNTETKGRTPFEIKNERGNDYV